NLKELRDLKNDISSFDLKSQANKAVSSDDAAAKMKKTEAKDVPAKPVEPDDPGMVDETASELAPTPAAETPAPESAAPEPKTTPAQAAVVETIVEK
ncbi:MAG: hypothetical protein AB8B85_13200, partial [Paracoccaceae bacterium]